MNTKPLYIRNGQFSSKPTKRPVTKANPIVSTVTNVYGFLTDVLAENNTGWLGVAFVAAAYGFYKLVF